MDFRNYDESSQVQKAELRKKLEEEMRDYKGEIKVLPSFVENKSLQEQNRIRARLMRFLDGIDLRRLSEEKGVNYNVLLNLRRGDFRSSLERLNRLAVQLGVE